MLTRYHLSCEDSLTTQFNNGLGRMQSIAQKANSLSKLISTLPVSGVLSLNHLILITTPLSTLYDYMCRLYIISKNKSTESSTYMHIFTLIFRGARISWHTAVAINSLMDDVSMVGLNVNHIMEHRFMNHPNFGWKHANMLWTAAIHHDSPPHVRVNI